MNLRLATKVYGIRRQGTGLIPMICESGASEILCAIAISLVLLSAGWSSAQTGNASEPTQNGNYEYQGSFEFGYRFVDNQGSPAVYNTYVNQQEGPRLLEQTFNMRSRTHEGLLFDSLFFTSFGWGGDPENASRLRMSKSKWYNFNLNFRRDHNFWDYNLLANPLNPANQVVQVNGSPHNFETRRRWYDYNLTLLPQSPVRVRLGYSRNVQEGPSATTMHIGTDTQLTQNWRTTLNAYQIGADFKFLPRTNISYDQFLQYYKGDTSWLDSNLAFQLASGQPLDIGIAYNTAAGQPCATPVLNSTTVPPTINPACNGYLGYTRFAPTRTSYPTEQLTLQSNYFRRLDVSARASYSSSKSAVANFAETFEGLATRSRQREFATLGQSGGKRIVANADLGLTFRLTDKMRIIDTFRFSNFRIPAAWDLVTNSLFGATLLSTPNAFSPATCPPPFTAATCPQHNASSSADVVNDHFSAFLKQDSKLNAVELEYDFHRRFSAHAGYRFERRGITHNDLLTSDLTFYPTLPNRGVCAGQPLVNGVCSVTTSSSGATLIGVDSHAFLAGITARPTDALRFSFDTELMSADTAPTRISPRNLQQYKLRGRYKPRAWMNLSGTMNILESRNNVTDVFHREHNRNYGMNLVMTPKERFGLELGYNYNDVFSTTDICYVLGGTPPAGSVLCASLPFISAISNYENRVHFGSTSFLFKPVKRVTTNLGYNIVSSAGDTLILAPTQGTLGSLAFNYHKPFASVAVDLTRGFAFNTAWGYFGYNEKSPTGGLAARDFHSNNATLSLRYSF
jgi:hypothetical protein